MRKIIADNDSKTTSQTDIFSSYHSLMPIKREFSRRFRQACKEKFKSDYKQAKLSYVFGVSQATISDWWTGSKMPGLEKLIEAAIILGVCVEWLGTGRGPKIPPCSDEMSPRLTKEQKESLKAIVEIITNSY
jgi:transcriptional regulator with XRE-family HTH domain